MIFTGLALFFLPSLFAPQLTGTAWLILLHKKALCEGYFYSRTRIKSNMKCPIVYPPLHTSPNYHNRC